MKPFKNVPNSWYTVHTQYSLASIRYAENAVHTFEHSVFRTKFIVNITPQTIHSLLYTASTLSRLGSLAEKVKCTSISGVRTHGFPYGHVRRVLQFFHEFHRVENPTDVLCWTSNQPLQQLLVAIIKIVKKDDPLSYISCAYFQLRACGKGRGRSGFPSAPARCTAGYGLIGTCNSSQQ